MGEINTPEKLKPEALAAEAAPPSLYADRQRVYPKAVFGKVRSVKWAVLILCLALYRNLAARNLFPDRCADPGRLHAICGVFAVWPALVRFHLPANGLDRSIHVCGTLDRR